MHKKYINKYGNFSHILNIEIDESLSEDEKHIKKHILNNIDVSIKWRVYDKTDLLHYYTDSDGIFADRAINEHTKLLLNDINTIKNSDKFKIYLSKPLTKSICIM